MHQSILQPITIRRQRIEDAIAAHRSYFERSRDLLRQARTDAEIDEARAFMANASSEIARWQAALEAEGNE